MTTVIEPFTIYVPMVGSSIERMLDLGAGIVGRQDPEGDRVHVHYENPGISGNVRTWADRCYHAADRMATDCPTHKTFWPRADELLVVGYFHLDGRQSTIEIADSEKVGAWLGLDYLPDEELRFSW